MFELIPKAHFAQEAKFWTTIKKFGKTVTSHFKMVQHFHQA